MCTSHENALRGEPAGIPLGTGWRSGSLVVHRRDDVAEGANALDLRLDHVALPIERGRVPGVGIDRIEWTDDRQRRLREEGRSIRKLLGADAAARRLALRKVIDV